MRKIDLDLITEALGYLKPEDRNFWKAVGIAIRENFGHSGFLVWEEWSSTSGLYLQHEIDRMWKKMGGEAYPLAKLIRLSMDHGLKLKAQ